ncbi:MAG: 2-oxoglutarate dehydrogenase E1 component [Tenuifilaceae bacterium]|jgi:2-oxoglutarate dehydrogenase E1 component|nr:2-oxoglutarate dehydrogenase E1 component [Tenuifilaceae bacterium]
MGKPDFLSNIDPQTLDRLYNDYLDNPQSVDASWRQFFQGFDFARANYGSTGGQIYDAEVKVLNLIEAYRKRGHLFTRTNPVRTRRSYSPTLDVENFGLSQADMNTVFQAGKQLGIGPAKLSDIIDYLQATYSKSIGCEYMYIRDVEVLEWLQQRIETDRNSTKFSDDQKKNIFNQLKLAVGFEQFIHKKFIGQKRFSLEGTEALIPAMDAIISYGATLGIKEFVVGMAHRGRLSVLANIMGKPYEHIFNEFFGEEYDEDVALGDVKYHMGYNSTVKTAGGIDVKLNLVPNPSHLETVAPVAIGLARAKINHHYQKDFKKLVPIIIHGDAAIAAQGVVYETLQMSQLKGYTVGGTIHLVLNNQVGFTTNYLDARSSTYSTDIAKVTKSPIFHVNADDPEALVHTIQLAMEYRQRFHTDVFIDILGYRRYGHNEGDEPRFTQPILYDIIAKHPNVRDIYTAKLAKQGIITPDGAQQSIDSFNKHLDEKFEVAKGLKKVKIQRFLAEEWKGIRYSKRDDFCHSPTTAVPTDDLLRIANRINSLPADKKFFRKLEKLVADRAAMVSEGKVDWAMAELLAYGSLVDQGHPVRLSGQDCERGTFSHRHAVYAVEKSEEKYFPLKNISGNQAKFHVYNSLLSEYGVMGFDYGYSLGTPNGLTIWEAQFGDFFNGAQIIVDQYISSAEDKWGLTSGLTLLLPHGFEGQGPEHSSARVERFLTMAARQNMQIANITTPANFYHALRRQVIRDFRTPLVVFTPKSLLRHPKCVSSIDELSQNGFMEVIDDDNVDSDKVLRVVFTTGKIYYDLLERKEHFEARDIALVRIEQLYPFPAKQVGEVLKKYPNAIQWLWVQEEPQNMGAWNFIRDNFVNLPIQVVSRQPSGSPAVGLSKIHNQEQQEIIGKVFRHCDCELKNKYCGLQCKVGGKRLERKAEFEEI